MPQAILNVISGTFECSRPEALTVYGVGRQLPHLPPQPPRSSSILAEEPPGLVLSSLLVNSRTVGCWQCLWDSPRLRLSPEAISSRWY